MEIFADPAPLPHFSPPYSAISSIESRFPQWPTPPTTTKYSCRYHYWKTNIFRVVGPDKQKQPFVYNISIASRGRVFYPINSEFFQFNFYFGCGIADLLVCKYQFSILNILLQYTEHHKRFRLDAKKHIESLHQKISKYNNSLSEHYNAPQPCWDRS